MSLFTANNVPTTREGALLLCGVAEEASRFDGTRAVCSSPASTLTTYLAPLIDMVTLMRAAKLYEQELTVDEVRVLFCAVWLRVRDLIRAPPAIHPPPVAQPV